MQICELKKIYLFSFVFLHDAKYAFALCDCIHLCLSYNMKFGFVFLHNMSDYWVIIRIFVN